MDIKKSKDVAIFAINYNSTDTLLDAIGSIDENAISYKIFILDNASSETDVENKLGNLKDVNFQRSEKNIGYTLGLNLLLKTLKKDDFQYKYILLFNPDVILSKGIIKGLMESLEQNELNKIVSPKITNLEGKILYSGQKIDYKRCTVLKHEYTTLTEVDTYNGAIALIDLDLFEEVGVFDANIFMYYDEIEFSERVKKKGYRVLYEPSYAIKHDVSFSTRKTNYVKSYYITRNFLYTFYKMRDRHQISLRALFGGYFFKVAVRLKQGDFSSVYYQILALFDFFTGRLGKQRVPK